MQTVGGGEVCVTTFSSRRCSRHADGAVDMQTVGGGEVCVMTFSSRRCSRQADGGTRGGVCDDL